MRLEAACVLSACAVFACGPKNAAKPNADGSPALNWLVTATSSGRTQIHAVAVGAGGELVIGGEFEGTITIGDSSASAAGKTDAFVARLEAKSGKLLWLRRFGGPGHDRVRSVAVAPDGSVAFGGEFAERIEFAGSSVIAAGTPDAIVGVYSASGSPEWGMALAGTRYGSTSAVAFTTAGDVIATGYFGGQLSHLGRPIYSAGGQDLFVSRFHRAGPAVWSVRAGGPGADIGRAIVAEANGAIAIAGSVMDGAQFGDQSVGFDRQTSNLFVAGLDADGRFRWIVNGGGDADDSAAALVRTDNGLVAGGRSVPSLVYAKVGAELESATPLPDIVEVTALAFSRRLLAARVVANPTGVGGGIAITEGLLSGDTRTVNVVASEAISGTGLAAAADQVIATGNFAGQLSIGSETRKAPPSGAAFIASWAW